MLRDFIVSDEMLVIRGLSKDLYSIPLSELTETKSNKEFSNYSDWVVHLSSKTWMTKKFLYDLALEIQRLNPANEINWVDTFVIIEREDYTDTIVEHENIWEDGTEIVFPRDLSKMNNQLSLESELHNEEKVMRSLKEGVVNQLKTIGLIK